MMSETGLCPTAPPTACALPLMSFSPSLLSQELTDGRYFDDPKAADKANFETLSKYFVEEV